MSLIEWSEPDEMLGLLVEYIADEVISSGHDAERTDFLRILSRDVENLARQEIAEVELVARALGEIREAQPRDFLADPVIDHLDACIEELRRIAMG